MTLAASSRVRARAVPESAFTPVRDDTRGIRAVRRLEGRVDAARHRTGGLRRHAGGCDAHHRWRPGPDLADVPRSFHVESLPRTTRSTASREPVERDDEAREAEAGRPALAVLDPREPALVDAGQLGNRALADARAGPPVIQPATEHFRCPPVRWGISATSGNDHAGSRPHRASLPLAADASPVRVIGTAEVRAPPPGRPCDVQSVITGGSVAPPPAWRRPRDAAIVITRAGVFARLPHRADSCALGCVDCTGEPRDDCHRRTDDRPAALP